MKSSIHIRSAVQYIEQLYGIKLESNLDDSELVKSVVKIFKQTGDAKLLNYLKMYDVVKTREQPQSRRFSTQKVG